VWGYRTRPSRLISSFKLRVRTLVDEAAENRSTPDRAMDRLGDRRHRARRTQLPRAMRPPRVVVPGVLRKHSAEVPLSEDQHPVSEFGADVYVPETLLAVADLLIGCRTCPGMIPWWR
jgi:hypothetical protein